MIFSLWLWEIERKDSLTFFYFFENIKLINFGFCHAPLDTNSENRRSFLGRDD